MSSAAAVLQIAKPVADAAPSPVSSPARIDANRANSLLSTGPKSAAGKAVASRNAATHGLTSTRVVLRSDEERAAFPVFEAALLAQIKPEGVLQQLAFQRLVTAAWNLDRCDRILPELATDDQPDPILNPDHAHTIRNLEIYVRRNERTYADCIRHLRDMQREIVFREVAMGQFNIEDPDISLLTPMSECRKLWADDECHQTRERDAVITRRYDSRFKDADMRDACAVRMTDAVIAVRNDNETASVTAEATPPSRETVAAEQTKPTPAPISRSANLPEKAASTTPINAVKPANVPAEQTKPTPVAQPAATRKQN